MYLSKITVDLKNQPLISNLSPGFTTKELQFYIVETTGFSRVNVCVTVE